LCAAGSSAGCDVDSDAGLCEHRDMTHAEKLRVHVRAAVPDDAAFLADMIREALKKSPTFMAKLGAEAIERMEAEYWARWVSSAERDPCFVAVAGDVVGDGERLGGITMKADAMTPGAPPPPPGTHVERWRVGIGVVERARGRGVGRALIERALAHAKSLAAEEVSLLVDPANDNAIALYKNTGFVVVGERHGVLEMRAPVR
jgi:GNAT superfamily N-acetyltransferase